MPGGGGRGRGRRVACRHTAAARTPQHNEERVVVVVVRGGGADVPPHRRGKENTVATEHHEHDSQKKRKRERETGRVAAGRHPPPPARSSHRTHRRHATHQVARPRTQHSVPSRQRMPSLGRRFEGRLSNRDLIASCRSRTGSAWACPTGACRSRCWPRPTRTGSWTHPCLRGCLPTGRQCRQPRRPAAPMRRSALPKRRPPPPPHTHRARPLVSVRPSRFRCPRATWAPPHGPRS